jgi:hypothetical protein
VADKARKLIKAAWTIKFFLRLVLRPGSIVLFNNTRHELPLGGQKVQLGGCFRAEYARARLSFFRRDGESEGHCDDHSDRGLDPPHDGWR